VVTIPSLGGDTIENYANELFSDWGIGKKDKNNGLLLLVAIGDRKARFEVGYDLEGVLTDLTTSRIQQDYMIPQFKEGDYNGGIRDAVARTIAILNGDESGEVSQYPVQSNFSSGSSSDWEDLIPFLFFILFPFGIYVIQFLIYSMSRSKSILLGGAVFGGAGFTFSQAIGGLFSGYLNFIWLIQTLIFTGVGTILGLLIDYQLSKKVTDAKTFSEFLKSKGSSGGGVTFWSFGGGHNSGGGSSFGGFGGGSSGGGGSSSSW
jgi:uncharacterized protein